ncbi:MAG TPA: protein kinase [Casimicrobiaceae bacterium]|nr:protein kinase [Casimicrobiaceae bacterium]
MNIIGAVAEVTRTYRGDQGEAASPSPPAAVPQLVGLSRDAAPLYPSRSERYVLRPSDIRERMEKLGRYQLIEIIGEGAMARVYKAHDPEINRNIAVKVLKPQLASDANYRSRFVREAKGAGILSHPNIVTIYDVGVDDERPYIAEELVEGMTLADLIRSGRKLSTQEIVDIGVQLARALDYAHRRGIIHRDMKPGNIMLVSHTTQVKVADFGICRIDKGDSAEMTQATALGDVLGTPNYMAPEQVLGQKVDARSDLFSAGVVLYKLLTGALPFEGDSIITVAVKIAQTEAPTIDKLRGDVPVSLRRVVERALRKQPERRYQSGEEMAQALASVGRELEEAEEQKQAGRRIPLGLRWALIMATLVALTMTATATILYQRQYQAMINQVVGYGESLANFMASQSAVPLLAEDWAAIEVFIQETMARQNFPYLVVVDDEGTVRGSNEASQLNAKYVAPAGGTLLGGVNNSVGVRQFSDRSGRNVLDFASPILFQGKKIGDVHLGILEEPLSRVARLILWLLGVLTAVTIAAVAVGTYLLARQLLSPLRKLRSGLNELHAGRYDVRIAEKRSDELGEVFKAFDRAATALEARHDPEPPKSGTEGTLVIQAPASVRTPLVS